MSPFTQVMGVGTLSVMFLFYVSLCAAEDAAAAFPPTQTTPPTPAPGPTRLMRLFEEGGNRTLCHAVLELRCPEGDECPLTNAVCECPNFMYKDGTGCFPKSSYDGVCRSGSENQCAGQLTCRYSRCQCSRGQVHSGNDQCTTKISYNGQCPPGSPGSEDPCAGQLSCDANSRCKCSSGYYHSGNDQCARRLAHGVDCADLTDPCQSGQSCVPDKNFAPKCLCDPISSSYWDGNFCRSVDNNITASASKATRGTSHLDFIWIVIPQRFVDNYQVATRSDPQSCLQAQDSINVSGSSTGVAVTGLRPGVKYLSTLTLVLTATTDYPERSKVVNLPEAWTKPAQPGAVIPGSSTLSVPRTVLKFGPSDGCVAGYSVAVTRQGFAPRSKSVTNDTAVFENLVADTFYTYFITAYNGDNEPGGPRIGSFTTEAAGPGHVSVLSHLSVIATGVVVSWRRPSQPNGNLKGYKVWVTAGGQCVKQFHVQCLGCDVSECQPPVPSSPVSQYDSTDLSDFQGSFEVTVTDLLPYTDYIVHIRAYNREVGGGVDREVSFKTSETAASPVTNVELESLPLTAQGRLDLNVSWVPGYRNGETNFTVVIKEKESLTSGNFIEKQRQTFQDTSGVTFDILENVLGHWVYQVTVEAKTNVGVAAVSSPQTNTTLYKHPGLVSALTLTKSTQVASDVSLSFGCPEERERNGFITGFYISKSGGARDPVVQFVTATSCDSVFRPSVQVVVGDSPTDYTFKVMASNGQYNSSYVTSEIVIRPLLPKVSEYTATDFTAESSGSKNTLSSFPVTVCLSCLKDLSNRQGILTEVVLAVCKNKCGGSGAGRRKRAVDVDSLKTWAEAKKEGFTGMCRATPRGWHQDLLRRPERQYVFTVGENNSCSDTGTDFCNGPLPSREDFQVLLIVCNGAGCVDYLNDDSVFGTTPNVDSDDGNVVVIVLAVICSLVAVGIILAVIFFVCRRRRQKRHKETGPVHPDTLEETEMIKTRRPILIRTFRQTLLQLHGDSDLLFRAEFEDLQKLSARLPHGNKPVDELPNVNVGGKLPRDSETMDVFKANYIQGYNSEREYIAAQGPVPSTMQDFWRMVWEHKCKVIVILSDHTKWWKGKGKSYWPKKLNESVEYGDIVVKMTQVLMINIYSIRKFQISMGSEKRQLTHFSLQEWTDAKADLTVEDVVGFVKIVRQEAIHTNSGPFVVHCSAGVGHTGTFIALDYLSQFVDKHRLDENIDVFSYVMKMRENCPGMVQTETQYIFIFDALMAVIQKKINDDQERIYDNIGESEEDMNENLSPEETSHYYSTIA
ncbi:phosphatidylinositol phosphatase PTPRQ [Aplysia californica]|uniref:Phosphatidylinositol phosphatase PTPRQ n=1 Tax=Aplysia californica TaxID=6500 RepID=A0ABM0JE08_APLCA|nr:phosphatidylinositol phosphatase PTPRQ [Aplysia californica]